MLCYVMLCYVAHRYFNVLGNRCIFERGPMTAGWIDNEQPRAYYMNNIALTSQQNEALWSILKTAPTGSKIITTSIMASVRGDRAWTMQRDEVPLVAHHAISKGKTYSHGLVYYTRVL